MAISAQGESDEVVSEINVTPLVDVMLVLLVVFIVTAPLLSNAVTVNLPKTALNSAPPQSKALTVSVDGAGKIYIDRAEVELARIEAELSGRLQQEPELAVQLHADQGVDYGLVAKAISAIDRGGVKRLSIITASE